MFVIPILIALLILGKLVQLYLFPFFMDPNVIFFGKDLLPDYLLSDIRFSSQLLFCFALALLIGLPLEMKFIKLCSRAYKSHFLASKINDDDTMSVLSIAKDRNGYITAADIASAIESISLNQAQKKLNLLQKQGFVDLSVSQSGDILYYFPGFDQRESTQNKEQKSSKGKRSKEK